MLPARPAADVSSLRVISRSRAEAARPIRPVAVGTESMTQNIGGVLSLLSQQLTLQRRIVRPRDLIHQAGDRFEHLYILNSGLCKVVNMSADGREQVVGLKFRGDWLGFDGIANGRYVCDAVAMDIGEVWSIPYVELLAACGREPALMQALHQAMSLVIARDRHSMMSRCTLPADARVAEFLRYWAESLGSRGMRTDHITLRMTRAEIGNYLGMTLETVSRALSKLARDGIIAFDEKGRRDVRIPDIDRLSDFVQRCTVPGPTLQ